MEAGSFDRSAGVAAGVEGRSHHPSNPTAYTVLPPDVTANFG